MFAVLLIPLSKLYYLIYDRRGFNIKTLPKFYSSATQFTFRPGNFEKSAAENLQFDQCTSDALTKVQEHTDKHNATTKSTVTCPAIKENNPEDVYSNSTENAEVR